MSKMLEGGVISVQLGIDFWSERWEALFEACIVFHAVGYHLSEHVDRFLEVQPMGMLENTHEVLIISVCLFFL